jgi:hypothetical protein
MWLLTPLGFFSVVRKPGDCFLTVRARGRSRERLAIPAGRVALVPPMDEG